MAKIQNLEEGDKKAEEASSGAFLRLSNDGDKAVLVFRLHDDKGNLCVDSKDSVWNEKLGRAEDFNPNLHAGKSVSTKFTMNVYVLKSGNGTRLADINQPKLFTVNSKTYKLVRTSQEKYCSGGRYDGVVFEMERKGAKGDTGTTYSCLPEEPKDVAAWGAKYGIQDLATRIKAAKFYDPEKEQEEETSASAASGTTTNTNGSAPAHAPDTLDEPTIQGIMGRLKAFPDSRAKVELFQNTFGVQKIRDLKASDLKKALDFLDKAEGKPAAADQAAVDPFA
jgi:hypothetical protein